MFSSQMESSWSREEKQIDRTLIAGVLLSFLLIGIGVIIGGGVHRFFDIPSFLIVVGGTFGATLVHFPIYDISRAWEGFKESLFLKFYHAPERIEYLVNLSQKVRQEGLLALEGESQRTEDPFMRMAFELTVDGQNHEDVRRILETEVRTANDQATRAIHVFQTMGNYSPALGLIGTLIGLIQMLGNLDNPATVGPAMSVALVTTLYGALLSNLVFLPIAGKLRNRHDEETLVKAITIEGILAIGKQENPIVVEQRLQGFLPLNTQSR